MSGIQNFFKKIFPVSWSDSMEKESREWMVRCRSCNYELSVWERGGIRWKAAGRPVTVVKCPNRGKTGPHDTYRKGEDG